MAFFTHKVSEKTSILYRKLIKMKRLTKPDTKNTQKQDEIIVKNRKNDFYPMILLEKLLRMR